MIETEAIVLHAFDYRETSRIVRLATRDFGVVSAIARGAKRPRSKFGQGLDLFTSGAAHLIISPQKELHTLTGFDAKVGAAGLQVPVDGDVELEELAEALERLLAP